MRWVLPSLGCALVVGLSPAATATPPSCNGMPLLGTPEEIAATPRAEVNLELLSVEMSGEITAAGTYDRVTADIGWIREYFPETAGIDYAGVIEGRRLTLGVDPATAAAIENGTYAEWDCLNEYYGLESVHPDSHAIGDFATLELKGIYHVPLLATLYSELPGVESAGSFHGSIPHGRTICGLVDSSSTHHYFIVVDAFGDCLSGCINRDVRYFTSAVTDAVPRFRGKWFNFENDPRPPWADLYRSCVSTSNNPLPARVDVTPDPPEPGGFAVLTVNGPDGNRCGPFPGGVEFDAETRTIRVTADFNAGCGDCPADVSAYSFDVDLGPLAGGEYQVQYFYRTWETSFGACRSREELHGLRQLLVGAPVAPVPVLGPAGLGVLSVILLGAALVFLRRQRRYTAICR